MYSIKILDPVDSAKTFEIDRKGVTFIDDTEYLEVYTDPFRSVPIYIHEGIGELTIFQLFSSFLKENCSTQDLDQIAFYESLLFGTPLWTRTIYKKIKQLPAATVARINKRTGGYSIRRYWGFDIREDNSIVTMEKAASILHSHLVRIFDNIDSSKNYCMGLSGGMDSRLSLAYLSKRIPKEQLSLFTFGFDKKILEYEYAKAVSASLHMGSVNFHRIDESTYRAAINYLPVQSLGQVAINHSHITSILHSHGERLGTHISNYYSDAIFGYAAKLPRKKYSLKTDAYSVILNSSPFIPDNVREQISDDIAAVIDGYAEESNYSSVNEFIYITERNPKFHFNLAFVQSQYNPTLTPYADFELLKFMISVPLQFREQKVILDEMFRIFFPRVSSSGVKEISSRFSSRFTSKMNWWSFRLINASNGILRILSDGRIQIFNKFQTEEQERILYTHFKQDLHNATNKFVSIGLMNAPTKEFYDRLPLRAHGTDSRFTIISLAKLLNM
jgi:hypothetical protein